ncbi:MAG: hypothetical protein V3U92_20305 [Cellulophaga sp.]
MKIQVFPNWCKKLGLLFFIIASLLNGSCNFINNSILKYELTGIDSNQLESLSPENGIRGILNAFTGGAIPILIDFIAIIGMLVYMLSKEKVEDDYINKLRLESFQLTTIFGLLTTILLYIVAKDLKLSLDYFIFPLLWSYILLFFIKRRMYL